MNDNTLTYTRLEKGNLIVLVPNEQTTNNGITENRILWSLKEFEGKVFSQIDSHFILRTILPYKLVHGEPIHNITVSLFDESWISDNFTNYLVNNTWVYFAMKQTYRYYNQIVSLYHGKETITGLIYNVGWHASNCFSLNALDQHIDFSPAAIIMANVQHNEEYAEELITKHIAKCEKIVDNYQYGTPQKRKPIVVSTPTIIKDDTSFYLFRDDKVYCGHTDDQDIMAESSWHHYVSETKSNGKNAFEYKIELPSDGLKICNITYHRTRNSCEQKVLVGQYLQVLNLIKANKNKLKEQFKNLETIVFDFAIIEFQENVIVSLFDKNWGLIETKGICIDQDSDKNITNKADIISAFVTV